MALQEAVGDTAKRGVSLRGGFSADMENEGCHCEEEPQALTWQSSTFLQRLLNNLCTEFVSAWKIATSPTAPRNDSAVSFFDTAEIVGSPLPYLPIDSRYSLIGRYDLRCSAVMPYCFMASMCCFVPYPAFCSKP